VIATSVAYSLWFIAHLIVALATVVVIGGLRFTAQSALSTNDAEVLKVRFPDRTNWAARVVHFAPVTGLVLSVTGDHDVALSQPWIAAGIALYLALAFWLEARVLPAERSLAHTVRHDPSLSHRDARELLRRIDVALVILALILITMIVQF
jgi:hypothetical protein